MLKNKHINSIIIMILLIPAVSEAQEKYIPGYSGDYFGQKTPGMIPEMFAEEILSNTICSVFTPDGNEMFFSRDFDGNDTGDIIYTRRINNKWTVPEAAPFNSEYEENDMCISHDGFRIFFRSWRPLPGNSIKEEESHLWYTERTKEGWSKAKPVKSEDGYLKTGYPGITKDGTLYFSYTVPKNVGESGLHYSKFIRGVYSRPVSLGATVNTKYSEGDMCISPDGSLVVVSCWNRPDNNGDSDLYVSFRRNDDSWTELINMGKTINNNQIEHCTTISPDGKYFFFFRLNRKTRNG